jgi:5-formyltetrahydrofolate cyclo-ligase
MLKSDLRKIYLEKRKSLAAEDVEEKSLTVAEMFFRHFDLSKINFLHCFLPIERFNEIDTKLIFHRVWFEFSHIETLVPRIDVKKGEIENLKFTPVTELVQNAWMIHEPAHNELVASAKIDAVLVPLLCFDLQGFRVGYGKGFYDKFLANCRADCLKIGLSYFPPVEKIADINEFDVKLDFCITPEKVFAAEDTKNREKNK